MQRWRCAVAFAVSAATLSAPAIAHAETRAEFHIPAQPLEPALLAFAEQAHVSLALPLEGVRDARSSGVDGSFTRAEALRRVLANSGFLFERVGDRAFRISAVPRHAEAAPPNSPETVIVTAARRPTNLRDLPRSLTDIGADRIDEIPIADSHHLAAQASGVLVTDVGEGRDKLYMRGVSDGGLTGHAQSTVGIYLDGVRLTYAAPDPQLQLVDVARVDILRGPQGALYGAGSIGGIFSIESHAPDASAFSGSVVAGAESTNAGAEGHDVEAILNVPLVHDKLAVRAVGYSQVAAGWLDNASTGQTDTNETRRNGGRLSAQLNLTDHWRVRGFAADQTIDARDSQYLHAGASQRTANFLEPHDNDFLMTGGAVHGSTRFGDLDSTTALVHHEITSRYDATGGYALFGVDPAQPRPMDERNELSIVVHETRLTSPTNASVPWFLGLFYADGDNKSQRTLRDGAPGTWPTYAYAEQRDDAIDEIALFGEATWRLTSTLSLSTGARVFQYDVKTSSSVSEPLLSQAASFGGKLSHRGAAPDIRLAYQPSHNALFYLSAAEGYRGPGFNSGEPASVPFSTVTQPFQRYSGDELWTYEAGTRLSLFRGVVDFSAAAFYNNWRRLQTDDLIVNGLPFTGNVGISKALGFESDVAIYASDQLTFRGHFLVNEPDLKRPAPSFPVSGSDLPGAPEITTSAAVIYTRDLNIGAFNPRLRAELDASYVGQSNSGFGRSDSRDAYTETDAMVGLEQDSVELQFYIDNLFDEAGQTFSTANPYASDRPLVTALRPRTVGLQVRRRF